MAVESITLVKVEDLPPEIRAENKLPETGVIEVRVERNSDPTLTFKDHLEAIKELRERLSKEGKLKKL